METQNGGGPPQSGDEALKRLDAALGGLPDETLKRLGAERGAGPVSALAVDESHVGKVEGSLPPAPRVGDMVGFVLPDGQLRPMLVTRVWSAYCVNGQLFTDGGNDTENLAKLGLPKGNVVWVTSVTRCEGDIALTGQWKPL